MLYIYSIDTFKNNSYNLLISNILQLQCITCFIIPTIYNICFRAIIASVGDILIDSKK